MGLSRISSIASRVAAASRRGGKSRLTGNLAADNPEGADERHPVGIKIGGPEQRDILDVFNTNPAEVTRKSWADIKNAPDYDAMTDEELVIHARNWEALCLYGWHPYMYNPQLKQWLGRISVPTLVLWGEHDGVVGADYGRGYAKLIRGAEFRTIEGAGHHPELEQPARFVQAVMGFLGD